MAAILDAMVPYVKQLIAGMLEEEMNMLLGVSGGIKKLEDNMESLKYFLADAERKCITQQSVQGWVRKLKDAMYDATDILDLCQLEADKRKESKGGSMDEKDPCSCQSLLFVLRNPIFAHKIGSRIKELNQRLNDIYKEAQKFNFINLSSYPDQRMPTSAEHYSHKMTSEFVRSTIVGEKIEQDTRELAQLLITSGKHDIKALSIVGTGGMGKTTLARNIFHETTVQGHFKMKVWLGITQHFDEIKLLQAAIEHAGGVHGGTQDKTLLTRTLTSTLSTGRFLLVLDDMWSEQAWSHLLSVPIRNASEKQPGNWVLITSRLEELVQRMGVSFYQHHVSPLNEDDAWALLNKQLPPPPNQVVATDHLRDVGMKIIRKCGGMPLAIKVMGGLLSTRLKSEREWEAVLNHQAWSVAGLPKEMDSRIYLSYEDLSPQLKQCFLYCSLFPKGISILQAKVVAMWISEGFIQPLAGSSSHDDRLEETANEYYKELIMRKLIEPTEDYSANGYQCTMHDVVRSFAEFMAREELLVVQDRQVVDDGSNYSLVRRMSLWPSDSVLEWAVLRKKESLRTLIIKCKINFEPSDSLTSFSRLRVLSISGRDYDRFVPSLCQLRHLRYFGLEETNISCLPEDIHRMKFLQHIALRGARNLNTLPRAIIKLRHLRTLDLPRSNGNFTIPKGLGGLTNLRTLYGFPVHMDVDGDGGWCSLEEIGPLSQLRDFSLGRLQNISSRTLAEKAMIRNKEHLSYLELHWNISRWMEMSDEIEKQRQQHVVEVVFEMLCPPSIQELYIFGYFGRMLQNWMMVPATSAFNSLTILKLKGLPCCTKLPDGLCRLPSLERLLIEDAPAIKSVGFEFQASFSLTVGGVVTTATSAAFPNMKTLTLDGLCEWEEWVWEEQAMDVSAGIMAMPSLEVLTIKNCKLRCLPPGLANSNRHALRKLNLHKIINLTSVEDFPLVVELHVFNCPKLKRISGLTRLHKIRIFHCPSAEVLEGVPSLDSLELKEATMETLPGYLRSVNPRYLKLTCSKKLCESLLTGSSSEYDKISHIKSRNIDYFS
ncbi:unnamed protein product [Urochloa decumbens]|uniref:Disease resistance protein RGA3 n=1 Tax=Urochloa decumbens TaxID=240449 RepID=A0ABC9B256_9POAL